MRISSVGSMSIPTIRTESVSQSINVCSSYATPIEQVDTLSDYLLARPFHLYLFHSLHHQAVISSLREARLSAVLLLHHRYVLILRFN